MTEKEKSLLAGCLAGEKAAWDAFVLQYSSLVYHTIRKTLTLHNAKQTDDVVEDLFQDFFISILRDDFKKLRRFRGDAGCSLASWVRLVAARLTIDLLRRQNLPLAATGDEPHQNPDPSAALINREEEKLVERAVGKLPPRDRVLIQLCFRQGLSPQDIAAILTMSVNAVYTQKSRILNKLREILEKKPSPW